jgi:hypothetical protein
MPMPLSTTATSPNSPAEATKPWLSEWFFACLHPPNRFSFIDIERYLINLIKTTSWGAGTHEYTPSFKTFRRVWRNYYPHTPIHLLT